MDWQATHGRRRGAYLAVGDIQLYIRQLVDADGMPLGTWQLFIDGQLEATADGELTARAAAETTMRIMQVAKVAAKAAAA